MPGALLGQAALVLLLAVAGAVAGAVAVAAAPRYNTRPAARDPAKLNVHIVCHSHDDAGWLKTVDQYLYGANNTIQVAGVQYILDTVMQALQANPHRKFIYSEMSFFTRWWQQQDEDTRALVTQLVESGQLEFVNGGYVQHDEATAHFVAMIDQTTRGHTFLRRTFGVIPRVGWQIDPFGHSATQAGLLSAQVGFDAFFFGRADYQDMEHRKNLTALEMVWRGSNSLEDAMVFAGNFASGNYGPPEGFGFEWACPPIMDDPRLDEYNVQDRVDAFVEQCRQLANVTRGPDIMLTMGSDFQFQNAHLQYKNLDKLIHYINQDGRVNAFYSTPAEYVRAKHGYGERWPLKEDDLFPYADFPHAYWTGYFTSRPTSKGYIRSATSYLQAARQLEAFMGLPAVEGGPTTDALEEAVSLLQHHDGITGTAKQHVVNDYHKRVYKGMKEAQQVVTSALEALIRGEYTPGGGPGAWAGAADGLLAGATSHPDVYAASSQQRRRLQQAPSPVDVRVQLDACNWLNITACNATVHLSGSGKGIMAAVYNSLAWSREAPVRVPVNTSATCSWSVTGPEGEQVASQLLPLPDSTRSLQQMMASVNATCSTTLGDAEVVFMARLPPLGYSTFYLQPGTGIRGDSGGSSCVSASEPQQRGTVGSSNKGDRFVTLDNGLVSLEFDTQTGLLSSMTANGATARVSTSFAWYNSSDGLDAGEERNRGQASGAYVFRPNGLYDVSEDPSTEEQGADGGGLFGRGNWGCLWPGAPAAACNKHRLRKRRGPAAQLDFVRGETVSEARQVFGDWATLVTRLYQGWSQVELEWTVGPIPFEDGLGREVVLVYTSDIASGNEFYTDANGREMIKRVRDFRPSWELNVTEAAAGNYFPLTAAMYIQDAKRQLAVLTERAQGGASLKSGQMEVMVHRRLLADDARGVAEPLNETACGCTDCNCPGLVARGVHWLLLSPAEEAAKPRRTLQQQLNDPPLLAFSAIPTGVGSSPSGGGRVGLRRTFSLSEGHILHSNIHLLTLKDTGESFLVRLAHLYQEGEHPTLSRPITENLNAVLQLLQYSAISELSLSSNQMRADMQRGRLHFQAGDSLTNGTWTDGDSGGSASGAGDGGKLARMRAGAEIIDCRSGCVEGELLVTLKPMEIRTFELLYRPY